MLNSNNVFDYLVEHGFCTQSEQALSQVEPIPAKNFNLLVSLPYGRKLLIKQKRHNQAVKTAGEFFNEWRIKEFFQRFSELNHIRPWLSVPLHFDTENSIIIFSYLDGYQDLAEFYRSKRGFRTRIASVVATLLACIHRDTFNCPEYQKFFSPKSDNLTLDQLPNGIGGLERIEPEIFGRVSADGLKFFALYQRYESLGQTIKELVNAFKPCCLTHNDLKLNNILMYINWEKENPNIVRLIDWERSSWGDPAFDLGMLIASYLQIWLNSLVISTAISIEESLRLAVTPLEQLQPSLAVLTIAYFDNFPEILEHRPDFWRRVMQFAGLALTQEIQAMIQYENSFGNLGVCMLQVAKSLLCRPEQSMPTIFGSAATELPHLSPSARKITVTPNISSVVPVQFP